MLIVIVLFLIVFFWLVYKKLMLVYRQKLQIIFVILNYLFFQSCDFRIVIITYTQQQLKSIACSLNGTLINFT